VIGLLVGAIGVAGDHLGVFQGPFRYLH
jgi:hypothetical protein